MLRNKLRCKFGSILAGDISLTLLVFIYFQRFEVFIMDKVTSDASRCIFESSRRAVSMY